MADTGASTSRGFAKTAGTYPESIAVRRAIATHDRAAIAASLAAIETDGDRGWILQVVADADPRADLGPTELDSPEGMSLAVLEAHLWLQRAGRIRGSANSGFGSQEQLDRYREALVTAERTLLSIVTLDPGNIDAWALRVATAGALELGAGEAQRRYDRLAALSLGHLPAQRSMVRALRATQHAGTPPAMEFARAVQAGAAPGGFEGVLIADAHLEAWSDLAADGPGYLRQQWVIDEVVAAADSSVLHSATRAAPGWLEVNSVFALVFSLVELPRRAAPHFRELGNLAVEETWSYLTDPIGHFEKCRRAAAEVR